jgi:energy-coupling factor transport system ATP-binding protein
LFLCPGCTFLWRLRLAFIKLEHVNFSYFRNNPVVKNISLQIEKQEITAITGPNGSGKTTLGKLIIGILKPEDGKIFIDGIDNSKMTLGQIGSRIGYLFQNPDCQIFTTTVIDELAFVLKFRGAEEKEIKKNISESLELFDLADLQNSYTFNLSQGEKQRLAIAAIMVNKPEYLILDEPTSGLDIERKAKLTVILKNLVQNGIGMTAISHDRTFVDLIATKKIKMAEGEIIEDNC